MENSPELIVMLTHHDRTVQNASAIFEECRNSKAKYWGFKEEPLPDKEMRELFHYMKDCGKKTILEVVAYEEETCLQGAKTAVACGTDYLAGTKFYDSVNDYCLAHGLKYLPFVGNVHGRPSILEGTVEDMILEAKQCLAKGAYGIDLLGYRHPHDPFSLIQTFVKEVDAPVCVAGSIGSRSRLDEIKAISPWSFTIGSAFFEHAFGDGMAQQIDFVCDYLRQP